MAPKHVFTSRQEICRSLAQLCVLNDSISVIGRSNTDLINSWLMRVGYSTLHEKVTHHQSGTQYLWEVTNTIEWRSESDGAVIMRAVGTGHHESKKGAINKAYGRLIQFIDPLCVDISKECAQKHQRVVVSQMESETPEKLTVGGDATQESDKQHNTIVTHDQQQTKSNLPTPGNTLVNVCSTEPVYTFQDVTNRWMAETVIEISTTQTRGSIIRTFNLPQSLYDNQACASNIMPFEVFVMGRYDIEMKFVVNANKFQCGKVLVSAKFDHFGNETVSNGYQAALGRPHVMLDLATNTEGVLKIPYRYHRNFTRNVRVANNYGGIEVAKYAQVTVQILSPLKTGAGGATTMRIRPFYRITNADFAGMSYRTVITSDSITSRASINGVVSTVGGMAVRVVDPIVDQRVNWQQVRSQMDVLGDAIGTIGQIVTALPKAGIKASLVGAQTLLDQIGHAANEDKPTDLRQHIFIPRPRMNFCAGVGTSDAIPLRVNPHAMTTFLPDHRFEGEPRSLRDLARIWGLRSALVWSTNSSVNSELWSMPLDPSCRTFETYDGQPTPLEYVCGMTMFWTGTVELRFDFVTNAFHTGTVVCSIEFNRPSTSETECERYSNYTKTFHLGEQKTFHVRVPYIYDTVWRRSRVVPYFPQAALKHADDVITNAADENRTIASCTWRAINAQIKLSVVNPLNPIASAPQEVEVLVYQRAGPDFHVHGLCQQNYVISETVLDVQQFPPLPTGTYPVTQMDNGEKENVDSTDDFQVGAPRNHIQTNDDQTNLLNILKRPVLLYNRVRVPALDYTHDTTWQSTRCLRIPIKPPSRDLADALIDLSFGYPTQSIVTNRYARTVLYTPQAAIMNLFAFHRGSQRYTFVIHGDVTNPIYITHVPHSGVQYHGVDFFGQYGTINFFSGAENTQVDTAIPFPAYGCGLTTEMIIPRVNPTMTFEVPFDTENNWTKTWESNKNSSIPLTDKGDYNSGHLLVQCATEVIMDVWWAAGDDFEIANFYGIPPCMRRNVTYLVFDDRSGPDQTVNATTARAQMDEMEEWYRCPPTLENVVNAWDGCRNQVLAHTWWSEYGEKLPEGFEFNQAVLESHRWSEQAPNTFQDFRSSYLTTLVEQVPNGMAQVGDGLYNTFKNLRFRDVATNAALAAIPIVGAPLLIGKLSGKAEYAMDALTEATAGVKDGMDSLITVVNAIMDKIGVGVDYMFGALEYGRILFDFFLDLIVIINNQNVTNITICFTRLFSRFLPACANVTSWTESIGAIFRKLISRPATAQVEDVPIDLDEKDKVTLLGAAIGILGTVLGVAMVAPMNLIGWVKTLSFRLTSSTGIGFINGVIRLVTTCFSVFQRVYYWMIGHVSPETHALYMLSNKSDVVKKFVQESQLMLNEANASLFNQPQMRKRFWTNVMQAYQLHKLACTVPGNAVSPHLVRLCSEVIKEGRERFIDLSASPVRFEPFVLCIEGSTALGKSFMSEEIMVKMLQAAGFDKQVLDIAYVRVPGTKHWSGMRDQPVIVYDDWLNLNSPEHVGEQLSELYSLKSTAVFTPPMAHLEDKRIRINPLMVILLTNGAFPDSSLAAVANHKNAIYRRRDCVLHVKMHKDYEGMHVRDLPREVTESFKHLEFFRYTNVSDRTSCTKHPVPFDQALDYLCKTFKRYTQIEAQNVQTRVSRSESLYSNADQRYINLEDPFSLFYSTEFSIAEDEKISQNAYLPSEKLALEIDLLAKKLDEVQANPPVKEIDPKPYDPFIQLRPEPPRLPQAQGLQSWWTFFRNNFVGKCIVDIYAKCYKCTAEHVPLHMCPNCTDKHGHVAYLCASCCDVDKMIHMHEDLEHAVIHVLDENLLVKLKELQAGVGWWEYVKQLFHRVVWGASVGYLVSKIVSAWCWAFNHEEPIFLRHLGMAVSVRQSIMDFVPKVRTQVIGKVLAQNDEWQVPAIISPVQEEQAVIKVTINPKFIDKFCKVVYNPTHITVCLHKYFLEHMDGLIYANRIWTLSTLPNIEQIQAPDAWCCDTCFWKENPDKHMQFMKTYIKNKYMSLMNALLGMVNNPGSAAEYWKRIPYFVAPDWVEPSLYMPENELEKLTGKQWWLQLDATSVVSRIGKLLAMVVVGMGGLYYVYTKCASIFGWCAPTFQDSAEIAIKKQAIVRTHEAAKTFRRPAFQGESQNIDDIACKLILRNMFTITIKEGNVVKRVVAGVGMVGHLAIMPKHYLTALGATDWGVCKAYISPILAPYESHEYTYSPRDFNKSLVMDLCTFTLPASFNMFKDIRKFVATDADYATILPSQGTLILPPRRTTPVVQSVAVKVAGIRNSQIIQGPDGLTYEAHSILEYNYSEMGACGGILIRAKHQRPILSMHFAGSGEKHLGVGYSVILTQELIEEMMPTMPKPLSQQEVSEAYVTQPFDNLQTILPEECNVRYEAVLDPKLTTYSPTKTKIKPSLIQGVNGLTPIKQPAILSSTDDRYVHKIPPLIAGCAKHGMKTRDFPSHVVERNANALFDMFIGTMQPLVADPKKLTIEQAVIGLPRIPYYDPLNLHTSAGFPYNTTTRKTKADYISIIYDEEQLPCSAVIDEELIDEIHRKGALRKMGVVPATIFSDTLKDERKMPEKVAKLGGTRVFCMSPQDYTIACRQNFLHFNAAFMAHRFDQQNAVGINVRSNEWTRLARNLIKFGMNNIVTVDYANFGPAFNAVVADQAAELMVRWTLRYVRDVDPLVLRVLMKETTQSLHQARELVYRQQAGAPSGSAFTTILNSLVNQLYIMIAWDLLIDTPDKYQEYKRNVACYVYGDDLVMAVSDKYIKQFNAQTIIQLFADYKITATNADKTNQIKAQENILQAMFLKHTFVPHPERIGEWLAKCDDDTVKDVPCWIVTSANDDEATMANAEQAVRLAFGHGRTYFAKWRDQINVALQNRDLSSIYLDWDHLDEEAYGQDMI
nr:hypothetical protein [Leuven Picorna-like virus 1]